MGRLGDGIWVFANRRRWCDRHSHHLLIIIFKGSNESVVQLTKSALTKLKQFLRYLQAATPRKRQKKEYRSIG
jgi:hypothetical protein